MTWWGTTLGSGSLGFQPKQKNRFIVKMGTGGQLLSVSSVSKPTVTVDKKEYRMINHFYNYPGIPKWEPITMKFVDGRVWGTSTVNIGPTEREGLTRSTSGVLWEMLLASGYVTPSGNKSALTGREDSDGNKLLAPVVSPEKAAMIDRSFGSSGVGTDGSMLEIIQINPKGESLETWTLYNPIITKISWGELDYGDDNLVEYTLDVAYDWAEHAESMHILMPHGAPIGPGSE